MLYLYRNELLLLILLFIKLTNLNNDRVFLILKNLKTLEISYFHHVFIMIVYNRLKFDHFLLQRI